MPPAATRTRSRAWLAVAALTLLAAGVFAVTRITRSGDPPPPPDAAIAAIDVMPIDVIPIDAEQVRDTPTIDILAIDAPVDALSLDASLIPRSARDAASGDAGADALRVVRKVRINARPWAYFTVDGGSTKHQTISTVELSPGPHRLHFSNPELGVERDVTIEVPTDGDLDHVEDLRR